MNDDKFDYTAFFDGKPIGKVKEGGESFPVTVKADELKIVTLPEPSIDLFHELHLEYTEQLGDGSKSLKLDAYATWDEICVLVERWYA